MRESGLSIQTSWDVLHGWPFTNKYSNHNFVTDHNLGNTESSMSSHLVATEAISGDSNLGKKITCEQTKFLCKIIHDTLIGDEGPMLLAFLPHQGTLRFKFEGEISENSAFFR